MEGKEIIGDEKNTEIDNGDDIHSDHLVSRSSKIKNGYIALTAVAGFSIAIVGVILMSCIDQLKTGLGFKIAGLAIISISGLLIGSAIVMSMFALSCPVKDQDDSFVKPKTNNVELTIEESCNKGIQEQKI